MNPPIHPLKKCAGDRNKGLNNLIPDFKELFIMEYRQENR